MSRCPKDGPALCEVKTSNRLPVLAEEIKTEAAVVTGRVGAFPMRPTDRPHSGNSALRVSYPPEDATPVSGPSVGEG